MRGFQDPRPGEIIVRTSPRMLEDMFAKLRPVLAPAETGGYDTSRVYLLLDELLSNVYRHGYGESQGEPIGVRVRVQDGAVHLAMRDIAPTFDVAAHAATRQAPPPDSGQRGGMGLFILYSMCESFVHNVPRDGGNLVFLTMKLPQRRSAAGDAGAARPVARNSTLKE
jgi:anti-sigma regulatory factor (Ser/Thr protein kinase)